MEIYFYKIFSPGLQITLMAGYCQILVFSNKALISSNKSARLNKIKPVKSQVDRDSLHANRKVKRITESKKFQRKDIPEHLKRWVQ